MIDRAWKLNMPSNKSGSHLLTSVSKGLAAVGTAGEILIEVFLITEDRLIMIAILMWADQCKSASRKARAEEVSVQQSGRPGIKPQ